MSAYETAKDTGMNMTVKLKKGDRCWWCGGPAVRLTTLAPPKKDLVPICGPESLDACMDYMRAHDLKPWALVTQEAAK